ncbi:MAG: E3 binding domain-containing protein, partial [Bacteroidetes bacterium]|nr:E3 binding domain-containing protein [Bacteroidota bacterium]
MQIEVLMPKMGESITEGRIVKWHKKPGEKIERDEILLEISTDKVDTEIPSSATGVLSKIVAQEQDTVPVGSVIAYIDTDGSGAAAASAGLPKAVSEPEPAFEEENPASSGNHVRSVQKSTADKDNRFFSPLVRSMAKAEGISVDELVAVSGSGSHGRITKEDVKRYLENRTTAPAQTRKQPSAPPMQPGHASGRDQVIPM